MVEVKEYLKIHKIPIFTVKIRLIVFKLFATIGIVTTILPISGTKQ